MTRPAPSRPPPALPHDRPRGRGWVRWAKGSVAGPMALLPLVWVLVLVGAGGPVAATAAPAGPAAAPSQPAARQATTGPKTTPAARAPATTRSPARPPVARAGRPAGADAPAAATTARAAGARAAAPARTGRTGRAARPVPVPAADPDRTEPPATPAAMLDPAVQPRAAQLDLVIDPAQPGQRGTLGLELALTQPTQTITLHAAASVQVSAAYLESGAHRIAAQVQAAEGERVVLRLARAVAAGPVRLTLTFSSIGRERDTDGLVRLDHAGDRIALTRFEPASVRRLIPLADEPGWRLPWTLSLTVPAGLQAIANTLLQVQEPAEEPGWAVWRFAPTPPLPGQALAFAIGPFDDYEATTPGAVSLRVIAPRSRAADARSAAALAPALLAALEEELGTPYPFTKLDLLAVPLAAGLAPTAAPGLLTLEEARLLPPAGVATPAWRRAFLSDAAPALARQWFGGLVSPAGWDEAWLAEALAGWLGARVAGPLQADPGGEQALARTRARALQADWGSSARPLQRPVRQDDDYGSLAEAARHDKGAALLAMLEGWLGPERTRAVVRRLIERHAWGLLRVDDLADAMAATDPALPEVLRGYSTQPGVPRVQILLSCRPGATPQLRVAQGAALPLGTPRADGPAPVWRIPMVLRTASARYRLMLDSPEATLTLPEASCPAWVQAQTGGRGLYRISQSAEAWLALARHPALTAAEARTLADDARAQHAAGELNSAGLLAIAAALAAQPAAAVTEAAIGLFEHLQSLAGPDQRTAQATRWQQAFGARARALGWLPRPGDSDDDRLLRARLLPALATQGGDAALADQALALVRAARAGGAPLPAEVQASLLQTAAHRGDAALFDVLARRLPAAADRDERAALWAALGRFTEPALAERARELLLEASVDLREALPPLIGAQAAEPAQREAALAFLGQYQRAFARRLGRDGPVQWPALWAAGCPAGEPPALRRVLGPLLTGLRGGARALDQAEAQARHCSAWRAHHGALP